MIHWACLAGTRDFSSTVPWLLLAQYKIFFHRPTLPLSPSPSKLGRQPCWVACLLVCVSDVDSQFVHFKVTWGLYWFFLSELLKFDSAFTGIKNFTSVCSFPHSFLRFKLPFCDFVFFDSLRYVTLMLCDVYAW